MINLNEQIKKYFKVVGILVGVLFLWGVFNLFSGRSFKNRMPVVQKGMPMMGEMHEDIEYAGTSNRMESDGLASRINKQTADPSNLSDGQFAVDKKIIKNGNLSLKVEKVEMATEKISQIVKNLGGEVFSTNFQERVKGQRRGNLTVKVPVSKFSEAISEIKNVATQVVNESTTGRDVTEQYADLQIRLKNKQAEEISFVKILDRAGKIDDVLAVTKQISRVRGEIERLQGQIKYMNSQTEMSTITINLKEDTGIASVGDNWRPWQTVKIAFKDLVNNIQNLIDGIIRFLIVGVPSLIPFVIFLAIIYWAVKKIYRKIKD